MKTRALFVVAGFVLATPLAGAATYSGITSNEFNPAISLILNGKFSRFDNDPQDYALPGFALAEETGPGEEGFSLGESELTASANIDDLFFGSFTAALTPEDSVEVEEAFIETIGLGQGFTVKAGRFFSDIGYLNIFHSHAWDFADQPLVYRAMLGNQLADDGVQLRWLAPTDFYMEFGAEAYRGEAFPAGGAADDGKGSQALFVHFGGDFNVSHSWQLGVSHLMAEADGRQTGDPSETFSGDSDLTIVDWVWKWAPRGNPTQTSFKLQAEYFQRSESGTYEGNTYDADQSGYYIQGVYQFMPRWRLGLRYDALSADDPGAAFTGTALDTPGHDPERWSAMIDWSRTEFSRLRLQVNRDDSRPDSDTQLYLQYVMSLGAHGAHRF